MNSGQLLLLNLAQWCRHHNGCCSLAFLILGNHHKKAMRGQALETTKNSTFSTMFSTRWFFELALRVTLKEPSSQSRLNPCLLVKRRLERQALSQCKNLDAPLSQTTRCSWVLLQTQYKQHSGVWLSWAISWVSKLNTQPSSLLLYTAPVAYTGDLKLKIFTAVGIFVGKIGARSTQVLFTWPPEENNAW